MTQVLAEVLNIDIYIFINVKMVDDSQNMEKKKRRKRGRGKNLFMSNNGNLSIEDKICWLRR